MADTIQAQHPLYAKNIARWEEIEDVTSFENVERFLIELNPQDASEDNKVRNLQYRQRAVFYAIAAQTVQGMVGSMFRKWPTINIPESLEYLKKNADGGGKSIYQSSQRVAGDVLRKGRAGIHVSFPPVDGTVSRADMQSGRMAATIHRYTPEQIINWKTEQDGAQNRLILVVVAELDDVSGNDYAHEPETIYREMVLDYQRDEQGNPASIRREIYRERIWRKTESGYQISEEYTPTDSTGSTWDEIPFVFVGSEDNDPEPDFAPMLPITKLNIGHYRNSADLEDSSFFAGQPQPWMSGITADYLDMMKENKMYVGSRNLIGVPEGQQFAFAQASPNTLARQLMIDKVEAMIQLGARLLTVGSATKTATQAEIEGEASTSVMAMVAGNVADAYTLALKWVCRYMGVPDTDVSYEIDTEFVALKATPQEIQQIVAGFIQGAIPMGDYIRYMRKQEVFADDVSDDDYMELLGNAGAM